jgi:ubiquinone/menaquinone biosynthesis C-methylase UbiE
MNRSREGSTAGGRRQAHGDARHTELTSDGQTGTFEERYSTASVPLVPQVIESLDLSNVGSVADLGCGSGRFALAVAACIGPQGVVHAVDSSQGALDETERRAREAGLRVDTIRDALPDISHIPDGSVDLVMLNFILHLLSRPAVDRCLERVHALLSPTGQLLVTGFGRHHAAEIFGWFADALVALGMPPDAARREAKMAKSRVNHRFAIDDGPAAIRHHFDQVTLTQYDDMLEAPIEEIDQMVVPALFGRVRQFRDLPEGVPPREVVSAFREVMRSHASDGRVRVRSDIGTLTATRRRHQSWSMRI